MSRDQVFISYSHKDRKWLDRLQTMLRPLVRNKLAVWDDTKIAAGAKWKTEIDEALAAAKVAVLLVSPYFLDSDFIANHELPPLLKAAKEGGVVILWVYISKCLWDETEIRDYQAAHDITKPLDSLSSHNQNAILADICREIGSAANPVDLPREYERDAVRTTQTALLEFSMIRLFHKPLESSEAWSEIGDGEFQRSFEVVEDPVFDITIDNKSSNRILVYRVGVRILRRKPGIGGTMGAPSYQIVGKHYDVKVHCPQEWKGMWGEINDKRWTDFTDPIEINKSGSRYRFTLTLENVCDVDSASSSEVRFYVVTGNGIVAESKSIWLLQ